MRTIRIYQKGAYEPGETVTLADNASRHVATVLRMKEGGSLTLFSGDNREFLATIVSVNKKKVVVTITDVCDVNRESPLPIHLAQAISKGDRMEWVVQKAVELGVTSITPVLSERSVVRLDETRLEKKQLQWQAIAAAACEQCGRNQLPIIFPVQRLADYLTQAASALKLILSPIGEHRWRHYDLRCDDISLLIGPEGGFSTEEIMHAGEHGFQPLLLGPRVLRTETAAVAALSVLQALGGDL